MFGTDDCLAVYDPTTGKYESLGSGWESLADVHDYIEANYPAGPGTESLVVLLELEQYP